MNNQGRKENLDGITVVSTSGLIFNNHLYNYTCDSLSDLAQRRPCARKETELNQWLRVERNHYENGVLKTEGTSEPENGIIYVNNQFHNVRLVDYHRKWRSYYLLNTWSYDKNYNEKSAFYQVNQEPTTNWHAPYFGSLVFVGNYVRTKAKTHLWVEYPSSTPDTRIKIFSDNNLYVGNFNSFYSKKQGTYKYLQSLEQIPLRHYLFRKSVRYPWFLNNKMLLSPQITIPTDSIVKCNTVGGAVMDSKYRYQDSYGCFFGEYTSVWSPSMPMILPEIYKIAIDKNIYVHQNYAGEYRMLKTHVGSQKPK